MCRTFFWYASVDEVEEDESDAIVERLRFWRE